jgi:hypothetical protein
VAEFGKCGVEAGGIAGRDRVGDGPVHRRLAPQFLMCQVANGDNEIAILLDVGDVAGPQAAHGQVVASGGRDRARLDPRGGVGAG